MLWSIFERGQVRAERARPDHLRRHVQPRWPRTCARRSIRPSTSSSSTRRRTSASPSCGFWPASGADRPNSLFFAGDLGQRIFQQPFSWKALGVDIRGRSRTLRVNYRTSHQIRHAGRPAAWPGAGGRGRQHGRAARARSPSSTAQAPTIRCLTASEEEIETVGRWLGVLAGRGVAASRDRRLRPLGGRTGPGPRRSRDCRAYRPRCSTRASRRSAAERPIGTMHLAKGLEFRAVVVMACDDEVIPSAGNGSRP